MKSDRLHLNSVKTQFIWVGSRQQLASVSVTEIVLNGFSIKTSPVVTCLGVKIDAELTFSTHVKQVAARCFYQLRQLWSIRPALTSDNAISLMLIHALIASRVDYCNSVLFQTAAVHIRPLQSVTNATARLVVKKRKSDSITPTLRDTLHWLLVRERIDFKLCLLVRTRTVGFGPRSFSVAGPSL